VDRPENTFVHALEEPASVVAEACCYPRAPLFQADRGEDDS
jgi:hypothetical protein